MQGNLQATGCNFWVTHLTCVFSVDNFQGEEGKIIILSLVRNNNQMKPGFLNTFNRINVMLTRAKHGMFIVGSATFLRKLRDLVYWPNILSYFEDQNLIGRFIEIKCEVHGNVNKITKATDFQNFPEGGCNLKCELRKSCGHPCEYKCHIIDRKEHKTFHCTQRCEKIVPDCPCKKKELFEDPLN